MGYSLAEWITWKSKWAAARQNGLLRGLEGLQPVKMDYLKVWKGSLEVRKRSSRSKWAPWRSGSTPKRSKWWHVAGNGLFDCQKQELGACWSQDQQGWKITNSIYSQNPGITSGRYSGTCRLAQATHATVAKVVICFHVLKYLADDRNMVRLAFQCTSLSNRYIFY